MGRLLKHPGLLSFAALAVLLLAFPEIDLYVSGLFYRQEEGFYLADTVWAQAVYEGTHWYGMAVISLLLGVLLLGSLSWFPRLRSKRAAAAFLLLAIAAGPGLMVNSVFKDHWDRARPSQVDVFGGTAQFTPPLLMTDQCEQNCSFVSGHASSGFILLAMGYLGARRHRRHWLAAGIVAGGAVGFVRIVQGGHFFSDVLFSFFTVWAATQLVYQLFVWRGWLPRQSET